MQTRLSITTPICEIRRVKALEELKDQAGNIETSETDYKDVKLRPCDVVYADIPYEGTDQAGYGKGKFDKAEFLDWAQKQEVPIYVSEYTMPEGWAEIDAFDVPGMKGGQRKEKLWVQDKFAEGTVRDDATETEKEGLGLASEGATESHRTVAEGEEEPSQMVAEDVKLSVTPMSKEEASRYKPIGKSRFGNVYDQFKGKVKEAFDFLIKHKTGDLLGVFYRPELGDIDLVWGNKDSKEGLEHIIEKHVYRLHDFANVDEAMNKIDDIIKNGSIVKDKWDKATIEKDGYRVVISKNIRNKKTGEIIDDDKRWGITAFDNKKRAKEKEASVITRVTPDDNEGGRAVTPDASFVGKDKTNSSNLQVESEISSGSGEEIKLSITPKENRAYMDAGNVIPLSERFNPDKDDIRFSVGGKGKLGEAEPRRTEKDKAGETAQFRIDSRARGDDSAEGEGVCEID